MLGAWVVLPQPSARADDTHYRAIPIGARAIGLAGAFTGVASDASAAYFNPAGLALNQNLGIAAGLTINAWDRLKLDDFYQQPDTDVTASTKTNRTVPVFVGAVVKIGPSDDDGNKRYALAISFVEPIFSGGGVFLKIEQEPLDLSDSYRFTELDQARFYGLSFAARINSKQSVGVSLYTSVRRLNHSETGLTLGGGTEVPGDPGTYLGASTVANTETLSFNAYHFVLRFGWLYRIKPQLQLGLMVQPPGIPLRQRVNVFSQEFINDNRDPSMPVTTTAYFLDTKSKARLPLPAEIEAGLQYWPAERVMLAFDASFHAPVREGQRIDLPPDISLGSIYFDDQTKRLATGNVAIAGDFRFRKKEVGILTGFFTDLSSAQKIPENPDIYYQPRINRFGATLSVVLNLSGVSLSVGSTFLYGRGSVSAARVDLNNLVLDYVRTGATSRIVYLHITGVAQAGRELGQRTQRRIKAKGQQNTEE